MRAARGVPPPPPLLRHCVDLGLEMVQYWFRIFKVGLETEHIFVFDIIHDVIVFTVSTKCTITPSDFEPRIDTAPSQRKPRTGRAACK